MSTHSPDRTAVKTLLDAEGLERTLSRIAHEIIERTDLDTVALVGIHTRGVSLAQLEAIGAEVGLSPDNVREAIAVLGGPGNPTSLMGAPLAIRLDRDVDVPFPRGGDEAFVELLHRATGFHGEVERIGPTLTWTNQEGATLLRVTATTLPGKTHVSIEQQHAAYATGLFLGVVGGGDLIGTVTMLDAVRNGLAPALGAVLVGVVVVGTWLLARRLLYARVRRDARRLNALLGTMCDSIR